MPIFSEIEEGRAEKKYSSLEIVDIYLSFARVFIAEAIQPCKLANELSLIFYY
jgi:hypothetical protein